jgi:two-component system sensor histidine kinase ArlS
MNYKLKLVLLFLGMFFLVLSGILSFIYFSYADSRKHEFWERLRYKSIFTASLLEEVAESDRNLLKLIDQHTIHRMYDEKVLVFDEQNLLIYSSLDDEPIYYTNALLEQVRAGEQVHFTDDDGDEVVGVHYTGGRKDYVVLASAYDQWGKRMMGNLFRNLIVALFAGMVLIMLSSYFYIRQVFRPIDRLNNSMRSITENNLKQYLPLRNSRDELDQLALNYNQMQERLHRAFELQKSFVHHASHELKTPLARMNSRLEKALQFSSEDSVIHSILCALQQEVGQQADLIEGLILLHRLQSPSPISTCKLRLDELLFMSMEEAQAYFPDFQVNLNMDGSIQSEEQLIIQGNSILLKTCFRNLLSNAALYSTNQAVTIEVQALDSWLMLTFGNEGPCQPLSEKMLFEPFFRDENAAGKNGSGLGLSIVKEIAENMNGHIAYYYQQHMHQFTLRLPMYF